MGLKMLINFAHHGLCIGTFVVKRVATTILPDVPRHLLWLRLRILYMKRIAHITAHFLA
jgi:hypothetical protein